MDDFLSIDLHTHIRGSIHTDDIRALAIRNNIVVNPEYLRQHETGSWNSFTDFLLAYSHLGSVVKHPQDWTFIVERYLARVAATGTIYVEFMVSPAHNIDGKTSYSELISAISIGIERAQEDHGIRSSIIVTCVRHNGPQEAIKVAELVSENPFYNVVGFGLTGNERKFSAAEFSSAFKIAANAGLKLTAHTGEWLSARTVLETVNALGLNRIGHGIQAVKDKGILKELIERDIGFELCISSNLALGATKGFRSQPLNEFREFGAKFSLCTDDPEFFDTFPRKEYEIAKSLVCGSDYDFIRKINVDAVDMAFCNSLTKASMLKDIDKNLIL